MSGIRDKLGRFVKGSKQSIEFIKKRLDNRRKMGWFKNRNLTVKRLRESKLKEKNPMYNKKGKLHHFYGEHHKEESKKKIREKRAIQIIKHSEATKRKISESEKGKFVSEETKEKLKKVRSKRVFPIKDSSIEVKIQNFLKQLGIEFFTHQYMKQIEHAYQCDILIPAMNLVIECDGDYWHKYPVGREIDYIRTSELIKKGFKVLRLWEFEINEMSIKEFENKIRSLK